MRLLQIDGTPDDCGRILGVMHHPNDDVARRNLIEAFVARLAMQEGLPHSLSPSLEKMLLGGDSPLDPSAYTASAKRGIVAGQLLLFVFAMNHWQNKHPGFQEPSLAKAIYLLQVRGDKYGFGDNSKMHSSRTSILNTWTERQGVAHFWAAQALNEQYPYLQGESIFASIDTVRRFLGVAKGLLEFSINFIPLRSANGPLVDPDLAWLIPDDIPALYLSDDARFPEQIAADLSGYQAHAERMPRGLRD